ncbi:MAG TPA: hypothetical protein V6C96_03210, partial [Vampirovibrionales bacterium]
GKMGKSVGNGYSLDELEEKGFTGLDYRYFLLQAHYRSKQNFTWESLQAAKNAHDKLIKSLKSLDASLSDLVNDLSESEFKDQFVEALEQDFNIPKALAVVWEVLKSDINDEFKLSLILDFDKVLGLDLINSIQKEDDVDEFSDEVKELIQERRVARENKDWDKADAIRDRLQNEFGIEVQDS